LNNQLKAIHELERIEAPEDAPPAAHGVAFANAIRPALRDDIPQPSTAADAILRQAPETEEGYFVVPDIPHTDL
jgi:aspartyl/glutamyl-tRNA(Asn/Gln) amidotransferase C subunit